MGHTYSITDNGPVSTVLDALCVTDLVSSRAEGRKLILAGGFYLNDVKITDPTRELSTDDVLGESGIWLRKGKKSYCVLMFPKPNALAASIK